MLTLRKCHLNNFCLFLCHSNYNQYTIHIQPSSILIHSYSVHCYCYYRVAHKTLTFSNSSWGAIFVLWMNGKYLWSDWSWTFVVDACIWNLMERLLVDWIFWEYLGIILWFALVRGRSLVMTVILLKNGGMRPKLRYISWTLEFVKLNWWIF